MGGGRQEGQQREMQEVAQARLSEQFRLILLSFIISGPFRKAQEQRHFMPGELSSRGGAGQPVPSSLDNCSVNSLVLPPPYLGFSYN